MIARLIHPMAPNSNVGIQDEPIYQSTYLTQSPWCPLRSVHFNHDPSSAIMQMISISSLLVDWDHEDGRVGGKEAEREEGGREGE